jgi:hypothetical protein
MQRLHEHFARTAPGRVQFTVVTGTSGHVAAHVVSIPDELEWFRDVYLSQRRLTFPIAIWAPRTVPREFGMRVIPPSVTENMYIAQALRLRSVLVDSTGVVRGYPLVATAQDFITLAARIDTLVSAGKRE